jgi:phosphate acetyltransferase
MTPTEAETLLENRVYWAVAMLAAGEAEGVVSGSVSPTAEVMRPALQLIARKQGLRTVSAYFLMVHPDAKFGENGAMIFADCGLCPAPGEDELVEIAAASAESYRNLIGSGEPRIAMLSFSTKGSAKHPIVEHVTAATKMLKDKHRNLIVDGEMQLDAAIIPEIAQLKCPDSPLAGRANILIFPDLNAGNIGYKLTERLGGATAIGPIVQGLENPVNDLSRGCSVQDIVDLTAVTAVMVEG